MDKNPKLKLANLITYILENSNQPLLFSDINNFLKTKGVSFNKTSIYRYMDKLKSEDLVLEISTPKGNAWELKTESNHIHIICNKCNKIRCLELKQSLDLSKSVANIQTINVLGTCLECC